MALLNKNKMSGDAAMASNASKKEGSWLQSLVRNKLFWCLAGFAVVMAIAWLWISTTIVATVDGHNITKSDYNETKPRLEKFYQYNEDKESLKNLKQSVIDYLVENEIVENEAKERGLTASQSEIDKRYEEAVSHYASEDEFQASIKAAYDWTPELSREGFKHQILREKLESQVLARRAGRFISVQHRSGGGLESITEEEYKTRAKAKIQEIKKAIETNGFDETYNSYKDRKVSTAEDIQISAIPFKWQMQEPAVAPEALDSVFSFHSPGLSGVIETSGYYGIFSTEEVSNGSFNSWADFVSSIPSKTYPERVSVWLKHGVNKLATLLGTRPVFAGHCQTYPGCEASRASGTVRDGAAGGQVLSGVKVYWDIPDDPNINPNPSCLTGGTHPSCVCGPKPPRRAQAPQDPFIRTTGSEGGFAFNKEDGSNCFLNCGYKQWHINFEKSGYQSKRYYVNLNNTNGTIIDETLWPEPATLKVKAVNQSGALLNGITFTVTGSSNITKSTGESGPGTFELSKNGNSDWTVTAPQEDFTDNGAKYIFDNKWDNCQPPSSNRPCSRGVNAGNVQTITAYFRPDTPPPSLGCTQSATSVNVGGSVTFTATNGTGGTYGWTTNPAGVSPVTQTSTSNTFVATFNTAGSYTITVNNNGQSATCNVTVNGTVPPPTCTPSSQTVAIGQSASLTTTGPSSNGYSWFSGGGTPASGNSQNFNPSYSTAGTYYVTLTAQGQQSTCLVYVSSPQSPTLSCSPPTSGVSTGGQANLQALRTSGTGTFSWSTSPSTGVSPSTQSLGTTSNSEVYAPVFNVAGSYTVNVSSSGAGSATCFITVTTPPPPPPPQGNNPSGELDFDQGERSPIY